MSYLCISYAQEDSLVAQRFCHELTKYGFRYEILHPDTPARRRETLLDGCALLVALTSPAAEDEGVLVSDIRRQGGMDAPLLCVSLSKNNLDERFCAAVGEQGMTAIPYPAGEIDTPDERSVALFFHRLYVSRLCRMSDCFTPARCVDDVYGRVVTEAAKAWSGDTEAQYALGLAYASGKGVPVLETETAIWMRQAASGGLPDAQIFMGTLLLDGEGVEKDHAEALRLFSAAAKAGDARGQYYKGICCLYGYGLMKDPEMAVRYLKAAADMGYAPALYRLGLLYRDGIGTKADWHVAVKYLYLAACGEIRIPLYGHRFIPRRGENDTRRRFASVSMRFMRQKMQKRMIAREEPIAKALAVGRFCQSFCRAVRQDYPEDAWLYGLDASYDSSRYNKNRGYRHQRWDVALAEGALGRLLELGSPAEGVKPSPRAAFAWYRRAMRHGHSGAMFRLGDAYRRGRGVPGNPRQAVRLFRRAAEFGNVRGQFAMGVCCEQGQGLPVSLTEAVRWYSLAAEAGYPPAQNNLGGCFEYGRGVATDMLTAVDWYTRASAQGQPDAACRLGLCCEAGRGLPKNEERAFHLFEDASRMGHPYALYRLGLCYDLGITVPPQVAYAAHLYGRAAKDGVGEAAYAMALCCRGGRGVRKDEQESLEWLKKAAELGSIQGCFELGLCYFEGHTTLQNKAAAMKCFRRAVSLYRSMTATEVARAREESDRRLPVDCMTEAEAVGGALYMLGYGCLTQGEADTQSALAYFESAAAMERADAMTAMGDMYAYGLVSLGSREENREKAIACYETAAKGSDTNALLSLALLYEENAAREEAAGAVHEAEIWRERAWRSLARCAEQGHAYALVGMAGCAWMGHGTQQNKDTAKWFLQRANRRQTHRARRHNDLHHRFSAEKSSEEGNALASLWLGDLYAWELRQVETMERAGELIALAKDAYRAAAEAPSRLYENGYYVLPARIQKKKETELLAKAEANYRLAVLKMLYAASAEDTQEAFAHLGQAVLAGHRRALEDLSRLYARWRALQQELVAVAAKTASKHAKRTKSKGLDAQRRLESLGGAYYLCLRLTPTPFTFDMPISEISVGTPDDVTVDVTPAMEAAALNYLGDCYFYGEGLRKDRVSAVSCYRRAAVMRQVKGEAVESGIVWAQYSLGYCLLEGVGVSKSPREAVTWLTRAAKYHKDAAFCLAECYERGIGVDREDVHEALKYYRKALKLGNGDAAARIPLLEKHLREEE